MKPAVASRQRVARPPVVPVVLGVAWFLLGTFAVPPLIERALAGEGPGLLVRLLSSYPEPAELLAQWRDVVVMGTLACFAYAAWAAVLRTPRLADRLVGEATPNDLAALRMLVCGVLLTSTLWEDLASTAALPREMVRPMGVIQLLYALPIGFERFVASPAALGVFQAATALVLVLGILGWRTRVVLPLGAVCYLVLAGLLRHYAWFYHTGLLALYLLVVLCFVPAGDGWSLDRRRRLGRGLPVPPGDHATRRYGWARYALWTVFALPYVAAGLSKLRIGGLAWLDAVNFKYILFYSTLRPMEFDFEVSLLLTDAPDFVFVALAVSAVLGEVLYGLVLVSRRARLVLPLVMMGMHVGILVLQNILFFDLIILQLIFLDLRPVRAWAVRRGPALRAWGARLFGGAAGGTAGGTAGAGPERAGGRRLVLAITGLLLVCWSLRIEFYPFTAMQMFSKVRGPEVTYELALAHLQNGEVVRAPIEQSIGAMSDSRYRRVLERAFDGHEDLARDFLDAVVTRWNRHAPPDQAIRRIELQRWLWNYETDPDDPDHGELVDRRFFPF